MQKSFQTVALTIQFAFFNNYCRVVPSFSLTHSQTTQRLTISAISPLFVDRFVRSLRFCYLENIIQKAFLMVAGMKMPSIDEEFKF